MNKENWYGIMKVLEIKHISKDGKIIHEEKNILNTLHTEGEEFILGVVFAGYTLPEYYYLGLDNRSTIKNTDTLIKAYEAEPNGSGYARQAASPSDFTLDTTISGNYRAISPIVIFRATDDWDISVKNLFLTDSSDNSGSLISSAELEEEINMKSGEMVSLRIGLTLKNSS